MNSRLSTPLRMGAPVFRKVFSVQRVDHEFGRHDPVLGGKEMGGIGMINDVRSRAEVLVACVPNNANRHSRQHIERKGDSRGGKALTPYAQARGLELFAGSAARG